MNKGTQRKLDVAFKASMIWLIVFHAQVTWLTFFAMPAIEIGLIVFFYWKWLYAALVAQEKGQA